MEYQQASDGHPSLPTGYRPGITQRAEEDEQVFELVDVGKDYNFLQDYQEYEEFNRQDLLSMQVDRPLLERDRSYTSIHLSARIDSRSASLERFETSISQSFRSDWKPPLLARGESEWEELEAVGTVSEIIRDRNHAQIKQVRSKQHPSGKTPRTVWHPWELRYFTLCSFLILYILVAIVLGCLYAISQRNQGLSSSTYRYHYLWTYGPVAVLTIASVVWHRVDYRVRQLQPWKLIAVDSRTAQQTLLLDYVTPLAGVVFWKALRNGHFAVIFSLSINFLLKILIVFSTSFLVLEPVLVDQAQYPIGTTSTFSSRTFNSSNMPYATVATTAMSLSPQFDASYPSWTAKGSTIQSFAPIQAVPSGASINISVDAFVFAIGSCRSGTDFHIVSTGNVSYPWRFYLDSNNCSFLPGYSPTDSEYYTATNLADCTGTTMADDSAQTVAFYSVNTNYTSDVQDHPDGITEMVWLLCEATYSVQPVETLYDGLSIPTTWRFKHDSKTSKIPGMSNTDVAQASLDVLFQWAYADEYAGIGYQTNERDLSLIWDTQLPGPGISNSLCSADDLLTITNLYVNAATQLARLSLTESAGNTIYGDLYYSEQRVVVHQLSLILMEAILFLIVITTFALFYHIPQSVVPCDPGSIAGFSAILVSDEGTRLFLEPDKAATVQNLIDRTNDWTQETLEIASKVDSSPGVTGVAARRLDATGKHDATKHIKWWKPRGFTWIMIVTTLASSILMIAALETSLQISRKAHGFSRIDPDSSVRYVWVYIPALAMVLLGMLFGQLGFTTRMMEDFLTLRNGNASCEAILHNKLKNPAVIALWRAFQRSNIPGIAAAFAALVAPLLAIAVSGLFAGKIQEIPVQTSVQYTSQFNSSFQGSHIFSIAAGFEASFLQSQPNVSYPQWTWDTLVLPEVELASLDASMNRSSVTQLELTLPALQGNLQCRTLQSQAYSNDNITNSCDCPNAVAVGFPDYSSATQCLCLSPGYFGTFENTPCDWVTCDPTKVYGIAMFGFYNETVANITAVVCDWPNVEEIQTKVIFDMPGYTINANSPPIPDLSTAKTFSNQSFYADVDFSAGRSLESEGFAYFPLGSVLSNFDDFMTFAVAGRHANPDNTTYLDPTLLAERVEYTYNLLAAQILNTLFRVPIEPANKPEPLTAFYTDSNAVWLVQSAVSTRILEGLLALLFLCALLVYVTTTRRARCLLPIDPNSIAAMASLLAGSKLVTREIIPEATEWLNEKELHASGTFRAYRYSMGWFDESAHDGNEEVTEAGPADDMVGLCKKQQNFRIDIGRARWLEDKFD